jgi:bifunctional DNA-binding transcriptional regulator/antitoxin component of YhaV-PrlF toxin-antitoxin module
LNSTKNSWTLTIEEDPETGDGILVLPADLLEEAKWKEGDNLLWIDNNDGTWSLIKEDLTNFVINGIINNEQN